MDEFEDAGDLGDARLWNARGVGKSSLNVGEIIAFLVYCGEKYP